MCIDIVYPGEELFHFGGHQASFLLYFGCMHYLVYKFNYRAPKYRTGCGKDLCLTKLYDFHCNYPYYTSVIEGIVSYLQKKQKKQVVQKRY